MAIEFRVCNPKSQFTLANVYIHQMKREREREKVTYRSTQRRITHSSSTQTRPRKKLRMQRPKTPPLNMKTFFDRCLRFRGVSEPPRVNFEDATRRSI